MKTEIILFDHHYLYLEAMCCLLDKDGFSKKHTYKFTTEINELENLINGKPQIAVINILGLGNNEVIDMIEKLLHLNSQLKIVILSANAEVKNIKKIFDKGIKSFLSRNTSAAEFLQALNEVIEDRIFLSEEIKIYFTTLSVIWRTKTKKKLVLSKNSPYAKEKC